MIAALSEDYCLSDFTHENKMRLKRKTKKTVGGVKLARNPLFLDARLHWWITPAFPSETLG